MGAFESMLTDAQTQNTAGICTNLKKNKTRQSMSVLAFRCYWKR